MPGGGACSPCGRRRRRRHGNSGKTAPGAGREAAREAAQPMRAAQRRLATGLKCFRQFETRGAEIGVIILQGDRMVACLIMIAQQLAQVSSHECMGRDLKGTAATFFCRLHLWGCAGFWRGWLSEKNACRAPQAHAYLLEYRSSSKSCLKKAATAAAAAEPPSLRRGYAALGVYEAITRAEQENWCSQHRRARVHPQPNRST